MIQHTQVTHTYCNQHSKERKLHNWKNMTMNDYFAYMTWEDAPLAFYMHLEPRLNSQNQGKWNVVASDLETGEMGRY